jgi:hypothetical protein
MDLDKETREELTRSGKIRQLVKGEDWAEAKSMLIQSMGDLNSVMNFKQDDPSKLMIELCSRQMAIQLVSGWIAQLEGTADAHDEQVKAMENMKKNDLYIRR